MKGTMRERMAGALMRAFFSRPVELQIINVTVDDQLDLIDAILEEMRNPTLGMKRVGAMVMPDYDPSIDDAEECWREMIGAISKETPNSQG